MMSNALEAFGNEINNNLPSSNFNFETFEIEKEDKDFVIEKEKAIFNTLRKYNKNIFELSCSLFEVSERLKKTNSFMSWYDSMGLNKDLVSVLLKRYSLYIEFPSQRDYISTLSDSGVKMLTGKEISFELREMIIEDRITNTTDIKDILLPGPIDSGISNPGTIEKQKTFLEIKNIDKLIEKFDSFDEDKKILIRNEAKVTMEKLQVFLNNLGE